MTEPVAPVAQIITSQTLPIDTQSRDTANAYIEQRFQAAMVRRRQYVEKFKQDTSMELDATRRDSVHENEESSSNELAKGNNEAIKLLLEAWYERLGIQSSDGWTKYSEKTTTTACMTIRRILDEGDAEMGIPIEAFKDKRRWILRLKLIRWWFVGPTTAFDFLAAFGIGDSKIGCGLVRIDVLNYANGDTCVAPVEHHIGMLALSESNTSLLPGRFPPSRPCGCYEYKVLMKTIANAMGVPLSGDNRTIINTMENIWAGWLLANHGAGYSRDNWPRDPSASTPARLILSGDDYHAWFFYRRDEARSINMRAIRVQGPFGELL